jgi:glycosyltransferase 2 family protein
MNGRSIRTAALGLGLLGLGVAAAWVWLAGGPALLAAIARLPLTHLPLLVGLTAACVVLRFLRWQYLLRRLGVRVPTRASFRIYVASLAGIATPAYLGETVRSALLRREFGVPLRISLPAWLVERVLDFVAIVLIGAAAWTGMAWTLAVLAGVALVAAVQDVGGVAPSPAALRQPSVVAATLGLTVLAWLPAALILGLAAQGLGLGVGLVEGMRVFAAATGGGGLSLMPAGMGTTGSLAILQLQGLGVAATDAVAAVSVLRLATAGVTLAAGGVFLTAALRRLSRRSVPEQHFDDIAGEYLDQFAPHIWDLLLERKTALICSALPPAGAGPGLDLGCGLGRQALALGRRGYRVVGIDPAHKLVRAGAAQGLEAVTASGLELPFADGSVDFVYTVGVLHHLTGPGQQEAAVREVNRVLRPGGVFIVHETNPRNPLFRLYMGYVFPMLKSIDEGVERWIDAGRWREAGNFAVERLEFFTFLPDFLPRSLLGLALPLERRLERSGVREYSVHYMAVLRKPAFRASGQSQAVAAGALKQA